MKIEPQFLSWWTSGIKALELSEPLVFRFVDRDRDRDRTKCVYTLPLDFDKAVHMDRLLDAIAPIYYPGQREWDELKSKDAAIQWVDGHGVHHLNWAGDVKFEKEVLPFATGAVAARPLHATRQLLLQAQGREEVPQMLRRAAKAKHMEQLVPTSAYAPNEFPKSAQTVPAKAFVAFSHPDGTGSYYEDDKLIGTLTPKGWIGMDFAKDTNPKRAIGSTKLPLDLVSPVTKAYLALSAYLGKTKYGAYNYLPGGASYATYFGAMNRHMDAWWNGEECDPVDGTPHLANALTCLSILIEAKHYGTAEDDRPPSTPGYNELRAHFEQIQAEIKKRYADREVKHYTQMGLEND